MDLPHGKKSTLPCRPPIFYVVFLFLRTNKVSVQKERNEKVATQIHFSAKKHKEKLQTRQSVGQGCNHCKLHAFLRDRYICIMVLSIIVSPLSFPPQLLHPSTPDDSQQSYRHDIFNKKVATTTTTITNCHSRLWDNAAFQGPILL